MVWPDLVWYGMVWYGMVWYGIIWHHKVWYRMTSNDMNVRNDRMPRYGVDCIPNLQIRILAVTLHYQVHISLFSQLSLLQLHFLLSRSLTQRHQTVKSITECWLPYKSMWLRPVSISGRNGRPCSCSDWLCVSNACTKIKCIIWAFSCWLFISPHPLIIFFLV